MSTSDVDNQDDVTRQISDVTDDEDDEVESGSKLSRSMDGKDQCRRDTIQKCDEFDKAAPSHYGMFYFTK